MSHGDRGLECVLTRGAKTPPLLHDGGSCTGKEADCRLCLTMGRHICPRPKGQINRGRPHLARRFLSSFGRHERQKGGPATTSRTCSEGSSDKVAALYMFISFCYPDCGESHAICYTSAGNMSYCSRYLDRANLPTSRYHTKYIA